MLSFQLKCVIAFSIAGLLVPSIWACSRAFNALDQTNNIVAGLWLTWIFSFFETEWGEIQSVVISVVANVSIFSLLGFVTSHFQNRYVLGFWFVLVLLSLLAFSIFINGLTVESIIANVIVVFALYAFLSQQADA